MQIVPEIIKKVELAGAQLLAVTKYFSPQETHECVSQLQENPVVLAFGENRVMDMKKKNIEKESVHFIGNIQSRDIPDIAAGCSVVHSLCSLKHARIFSQQESIPSFFIQINISGESQKSGISPNIIESFLEDISCLNLDIKGISAIGRGVFDEEAKRREFQELVRLRDTYFPGKNISAGTSRDFEIALEEGIDIVRIGRALWGMKT